LARVRGERILKEPGGKLWSIVFLVANVPVGEHDFGCCESLAGVMTECLAGGNKLLLCGNGGSAGDAQHIAAEFVSLLNQGFLRPGLAAIALTTDTSVLTASANDFGFAGVFERQVQALGRPGDVVIGISTSGNRRTYCAP
jgi:phosphoheptose isomerase